MSAIQISPEIGQEKQAEIKITSLFEDTITAIENLDLVSLKLLMAEEKNLLEDLERVFNRLKSEGHTHLKAFPGECTCVIGKSHTITFKTTRYLPTPGIFYLKEFGLVFIQDKRTTDYKFFQWCADLHWKKQNKIKGSFSWL